MKFIIFTVGLALCIWSYLEPGLFPWIFVSAIGGLFMGVGIFVKICDKNE